MKKQRFQSELLEGHKGAAIEVPFDPSEQWGIPATALRPGRRGHFVRGTLNGVKFESAIVPRSKTFFLLVDAALLKSASVSVGDVVTVAIEPLAAPTKSPRERKQAR